MLALKETGGQIRLLSLSNGVIEHSNTHKESSHCLHILFTLELCLLEALLAFELVRQSHDAINERSSINFVLIANRYGAMLIVSQKHFFASASTNPALKLCWVVLVLAAVFSLLVVLAFGGLIWRLWRWYVDFLELAQMFFQRCLYLDICLATHCQYAFLAFEPEYT